MLTANLKKYLEGKRLFYGIGPPRVQISCDMPTEHTLA